MEKFLLRVTLSGPSDVISLKGISLIDHLFTLDGSEKVEGVAADSRYGPFRSLKLPLRRCCHRSLSPLTHPPLTPREDRCRHLGDVLLMTLIFLVAVVITLI